MAILAVIIGLIVYLTVWPLLGIIFLTNLLPGCPGDCAPLYEEVGRLLPGDLPRIVTIFVLLAFVASIVLKPTKDGVLRLLVLTHRYACILAPGVAGGEGFALPFPYILGAIIDLGDARSLRLPLVFLASTWAITLACLLTVYAIRRVTKIHFGQEG